MNRLKLIVLGRFLNLYYRKPFVDYKKVSVVAQSLWIGWIFAQETYTDDLMFDVLGESLPRGHKYS